MPELRKLANEFGFVIVVDETIGNFVNVDVLQFADIVVSSLTKVFSGETNVMGGRCVLCLTSYVTHMLMNTRSLVLNPHGPQYQALKAHLQLTYEDSYWPEDAVYMERNSRDFQRRIDVINHNAETIADFLRSQSATFIQSSGEVQAANHSVIKDVFYPKWVTRENYEKARNAVEPGPDGERGPAYPSGFGGLISMTFTSPTAARVFFDSLGCEKGPSLGTFLCIVSAPKVLTGRIGTNFTLACPYTVLAHYLEFDWAASWGVEADLVRVSVGMEDQATLLQWFKHALRCAEQAVAESVQT